MSDKFYRISIERLYNWILADEKEGKYFGPFVSGEIRDYIKELLNKNFMIRTCKKMPKNFIVKNVTLPVAQKVTG